MADNNFSLEDVENTFKKYLKENEKVMEDKLKAFTPLNEEKVKEIVSKKVMEFEVPLNKKETKTPYQVFKEAITEALKVKKD